jgi:hypothetical protein
LQAAHVFVTSKTNLAKHLTAFCKQMDPAGFVWVSWPKKASKVETDVTEDVIRELALPLGFVDIKVCAVSDVWSGLKLVIRRRARTTSRRMPPPPADTRRNQGQSIFFINRLTSEETTLGKIHEHISAELAAWIQQQRMFFVATAPFARDGHVNCSPKGGDSFRILDLHTVAYQDLTGSGVETIAHLRENGRIVIMFCALDGPPQIVRLYGHGDVVTPSHQDFSALASHFPPHPGMRAIIRVKITRVADSCGFGVPLFDHRGNRDALDKCAEAKGPAKLEEYWRERNTTSLDGLPGLED